MVTSIESNLTTAIAQAKAVLNNRFVSTRKVKEALADLVVSAEVITAIMAKVAAAPVAPVFDTTPFEFVKNYDRTNKRMLALKATLANQGSLSESQIKWITDSTSKPITKRQFGKLKAMGIDASGIPMPVFMFEVSEVLASLEALAPAVVEEVASA